MKNVLSAFVGLTTVVAFLTTAIPSGAVTLNPGDILVADLNAFGGPGGIFRVDPNTGAQTVVSSGGYFIGPAGIAIAANGDLLIANAGGGSSGPGSIIRVNPITGAQAIVSSGDNLANPVGLAIAANGDLFVVDGDGGIIRIDPSTGVQTLVRGPRGPSGIVIADNGDLIVAGPGGAVFRVDPVTGAETTISSGPPLTEASGIAVAANGDLLVANYGPIGVIRIDPNTGTQTIVSSGGNLVDPNSLAIGANGDIFVVDQGANAVIKVDPISGAQTIVSSGGFFAAPVGIAIVAVPTRELSSLAPASFWVGLKNSDDQGTQFDLRAEVYVRNALVSAGVTRCVTGVTRNATNAKQVGVSFGAISGGVVESGDIVSLRVLTRIGTNPDDTKCPGHNNAVGLRLYYDVVSRPSGFGATITPDPPTEFYLHSSGTDFLNDMAPTAGTAKSKDSLNLNFAGGNPWKEIGTWSMTTP